MQVNEITEHEDGSATLHFELTNEELKLLIEWALKEAIKNTIKLAEDAFNVK
jgi:hypothetical protein